MKIKLLQNTLIREQHNGSKFDVKKWDVIDVQKDLALYYVGYGVAQYVETTDASSEKIVKEEKEKREVKEVKKAPAKKKVSKKK